MSKRPTRLAHYLLSLVTLRGVTIHAYMICERARGERNLEAAMSQVFKAADDQGLKHLNIMLSTGPLVSFPEVEDIIRKHLPDGGAALDTVGSPGREVAFICWAMDDKSPDNQTLMDLH